jgi:hypothetical protein
VSLLNLRVCFISIVAGFRYFFFLNPSRRHLPALSPHHIILFFLLIVSPLVPVQKQTKKKSLCSSRG